MQCDMMLPYHSNLPGLLHIHGNMVAAAWQGKASDHFQDTSYPCTFLSCVARKEPSSMDSSSLQISLWGVGGAD